MRAWLIKKLGGIPRAQHDRLAKRYLADIASWVNTVERHQMQGAWEQEKLEAKSRRYH